MRKSIFYTMLFIFSAGFVHSVVNAQTNFFPDHHWKTVETTYFRVHFPDYLNKWALHTAAAMDAIHERVTAMVGYDLKDKVDVLVMDPLNLPNGMALPLLKYPRMVLWATAPGPESLFGGMTDWGEFVFGHEDTHLVHLSLYPRNPVDRFLTHLLPLGPVAKNAPRWVAEGYAVIMESRLTGHGRVNGTLRATLLRELALQGKLPDYSALNGDNVWYGGSNPYLIGSAFLEWLKNRSGNPHCFTDMWKRMTARKRRKFPEAFEGVFQGKPNDLYDRFRAEITGQALEVEKTVKALGEVEGAEWAHLSGRTGAPAISPDGKRMAIVLRPENKPAQLVIWSTIETEEKHLPKINDPEDVPDKPYLPDKRKLLFSFQSFHGLQPNHPRWMPDGKSLIFHALCRDSEGALHFDLYQWFPETGRLARLTRDANLQAADPFPDGRYVAAVENIHGFSALVKLDIQTGNKEIIAGPSMEKIWGYPKVSPDGKYLVAANWGKDFAAIDLLDLSTGTSRRLLTAPHRAMAFVTWAPDGKRVVFTSAESGIFNIWCYDLQCGEHRMITRTASGLLAPEPDGTSPEGLFFLKVTPRGLCVQHLAGIDFRAKIPEAADSERFPVLPPRKPLMPEPVPTAQDLHVGPYRIRDNFRSGFIASGDWTPWGSDIHAGFSGNDLLGRLSYIFGAAYGWNGGVRGAALELACRSLPVKIHTKLFWNELNPGEQNHETFLPNRDVAGISLITHWTRLGTDSHIQVAVGGTFERVSNLENSDGGNFPKTALQLKIRTGTNRHFRHFSVFMGIAGNWFAGKTDDFSWQQYRLQGHLSLSTQNMRFGVDCKLGDTSGDPTVLDVFYSGGWIATVESQMDTQGRISTPYLPQGVLSGRKFTKIRSEIGLTDLPLVLFGERLQLWTGALKPDPLYAAGLEFNGTTPPVSIVRIPGIDLRAGVAYCFDPPRKDKWQAYLTLSIHP